MEGWQNALTEEGGWTTVAPGLFLSDAEEPNPVALDLAGIEKVKSDFKAATVRALDAGFKVVEIHAAHGYFLHEFYSPLSNHRPDEYGGPFENRVRLLLEVVETVNEVWPQLYLYLLRISATDWTEGGWMGEDCKTSPDFKS